jgi:hypothetical protein
MKKFLVFSATSILFALVSFYLPSYLQTNAQDEPEPTAYYKETVVPEETATAEETVIPEPTGLPPVATVEPVKLDEPSLGSVPQFIPREQLPDCDESFDNILPENQTEPTTDQRAAPATCRLRYLNEDGSLENFEHPELFEQLNPIKKGRQSSASPTKSWAAHLLPCSSGCTGNNHFNTIYHVISAKPPSLASGNYGWNNYNVAHRVHYGTTNGGTCILGGQPFTFSANVSMGVQYGLHAAGYTDDGWMHIFWERFLNNNCTQNVTATRINPNAAILYRMYTTSQGQYHWVGEAWLNGTWTNVFNVESLATGITVDSGLEFTAVNQDKNRVRVPMNFIHKSQFLFNNTYYPWYNSVLPGLLQNMTTSQTDSPWNVMDLVGGNWTSISAEANIP